MTEVRAREAARLRTRTGRAAAISAADAIVVAFASIWPDPVVLTSDPGNIRALSEHAGKPATVAAAR